MFQSKNMARFVHGDGDKVVHGAVFEAGIEQNVANPSARDSLVVGNGNRGDIWREANGANPNVSEAGILETRTWRAKRLALIRDYAHVGIGVDSPTLYGGNNGVLPLVTRRELVECLKQAIGLSGNRSPIRRETEGQIRRTAPNEARRIQQLSRLQRLPFLTG